MTAGPVDSGTTRKSGVLSIGFGEYYEFEEGLLAGTSGFINVIATNASGVIYGGQAAWMKGGDTLGGYNPCLYTYPGDTPAPSDYIRLLGNSVTKIGEASVGNDLSIQFVSGKLRITNGCGTPYIMTVAYDMTIINH